MASGFSKSFFPMRRSGFSIGQSMESVHAVRRLFNRPINKLYQAKQLPFLQNRSAAVPDKVFMVTNEDEWQNALIQLTKSLNLIPIVAVEVSYVSRTCYRWLLEERRPLIDHLQSEVVANLARERPALIHLSSIDGVHIHFRSCFFDHLPRSLVKILTSETIVKVGSNVTVTEKNLFMNWGIAVEPWLDMRYMIPDFQRKLPRDADILPPITRIEVNDLPGVFFGNEVKPFDEVGMPFQQFSWWAADTLTNEQKTYATYLSQSTADVVGVLMAGFLPVEFEKYKLNGHFSESFRNDVISNLMELYKKSKLAALIPLEKPESLKTPIEEMNLDSMFEFSEDQKPDSERDLLLDFVHETSQPFLVMNDSLMEYGQSSLNNALKDGGRLPSIVRKASQFMSDPETAEFDITKPVPGFYSDVLARKDIIDRSRPFGKGLGETTNEKEQNYMRLNLEKIMRQCPCERLPGGNYVMHLKTLGKECKSDFFLEIDSTAYIRTRVPKSPPNVVEVEPEAPKPSTGPTPAETAYYRRIADWCDENFATGNASVDELESNAVGTTRYDDDVSFSFQTAGLKHDTRKDLTQSKMYQDFMINRNLSAGSEAIFRSHFENVIDNRPTKTQQKLMNIDPDDPFADVLREIAEKMKGEQKVETKTESVPSVDGSETATLTENKESNENWNYRMEAKHLSLRGCWFCGEKVASRLAWEPIVPESYLAEYLKFYECTCNFAKLCHLCIVIWRRTQLDIMVELGVICNAPLDIPTYYMTNHAKYIKALLDPLCNHYDAIENREKKESFDEKDLLLTPRRHELLNLLEELVKENDWITIYKMPPFDSPKMSEFVSIVQNVMSEMTLRKNTAWHHEYKVFVHLGCNPPLLEGIFRKQFLSISSVGKGQYDLPQGWTVEHGCMADRLVFNPLHPKPNPEQPYFEYTPLQSRLTAAADAAAADAAAADARESTQTEIAPEPLLGLGRGRPVASSASSVSAYGPSIQNSDASLSPNQELLFNRTTQRYQIALPAPGSSARLQAQSRGRGIDNSVCLTQPLHPNLNQRLPTPPSRNFQPNRGDRRGAAVYLSNRIIGQPQPTLEGNQNVSVATRPMSNTRAARARANRGGGMRGGHWDNWNTSHSDEE